MNEYANQTTSIPLSGSFSDPFKNWPNGDLLIDPDDRAFFTRNFPAFAPIFDWPELRSLFLTFDAPAARARKRSRRSGIFAVLAGVLSLLLAATIPLIGEIARIKQDASANPHPVAGHAKNEGSAPAAGSPKTNDLDGTLALVGSIAAFLAILSVFFGYTQVLTGRAKTRWLTNRFWTERVRQLHFQFIVNHLPAAIAASKSRPALQHWLELRAAALDRFNHDYLREVEDRIHHLDIDEAEDMPWIFDQWSRPGAVPAPSEEFDVLLQLMEQQRFGIQQRYAERKLRHGMRSPATLAEWVLKLSDILTFLLLVATITAGVSAVHVLFGHGSPLIHFIAALVAAGASAIIVAMRALKEGLLFSADAERYKWYLAAVRTLYRRYEHANQEQKVCLLRELERVSYQEMRRFILSGSQARFVM
jgi:hypothetical protein